MVIPLNNLQTRVLFLFSCETSVAFKTTWIVIERILLLFMIQEVSHQMMHYQAMKGLPRNTKMFLPDIIFLMA